jgi:hypothetical protein
MASQRSVDGLLEVGKNQRSIGLHEYQGICRLKKTTKKLPLCTWAYCSRRKSEEKISGEKLSF